MSCSQQTNIGASTRKTYDTDSITLRRIFAYDPLTNTPPSTSYVLASLTKGVAAFTSPLSVLSTFGWVNLPAQISTLSGELLSTIIAFRPNYPSTPEYFLPSTVTGLGTSGYVSSFQLFSTVQGLGSAGYLSSGVITQPLISTVIGLGTVGYVSTSQLTSTVRGLGSSGYVSSTQVTSTTRGLGNLGYISTSQLVSTVQGLGSSGYVSTANITSTTNGLGSLGYVSSTQLFSTVRGLGSAGYLSTSASIYRSSYSNTYPGNWSNIAFLYSNFVPGNIVSTTKIELGDILRSKVSYSTSKLDIEFKTNLQFGYYDTVSRDYQFNTLLTLGATYDENNIIGSESLTYYIQNAGLINIPYFFLEKNRFLVTNPSTLSSIHDDINASTLSLFHTFGPKVPVTNQLFASPMSTWSAIVVLDNTPQS